MGTTIRAALVAAVLAAGVAATPVRAADVTRPAEVAGLHADRAGADVQLAWTPTSLDATGHPEVAASYRVYRGTTPGFVADLSGGTNRIGTPAGPAFTDAGAVPGADFYYRVTAVDAAGNESASAATRITTPPVLTGNYTDTTIELSWSGASPSGEVARYLVYRGTAAGTYDAVLDVGTATAASMTGLAANVNYHFAVVAVDTAGNASAFSNEHVDCLAGRITVTMHDADSLCWLGGGQSCPPGPGRVQRSDGFQLMVPVTFPQGSWTKVTLTFTMDSRLCRPGQQGCTDKCGSTNPTPGGWNPCGDPWDRTAHLFLVLDDCIGGAGSCITANNLELMRAITPFGTDAPMPDGTGVVPPRTLTLDVTPFTPLLTGQRYVGAEIVNFASAGWRVTSKLTFSKRPEEASPEPPADGIQVVGFGGAPLPVRTVAVPASAVQVKGRLFTTGHGGTLFCDGGSNNGNACTGNPQCPGGTCQNCDEFCHRTNRILKFGAPVYTVVPFRTDCSPGSVFACQGWNACGWPSCTFSRAGWCPGYVACTSNAPGCDQDIDLTTAFPPGGSYDIGYDVLVQRGSWAVSLVLYWYD